MQDSQESPLRKSYPAHLTKTTTPAPHPAQPPRQTRPQATWSLGKCISVTQRRLLPRTSALRQTPSGCGAGPPRRDILSLSSHVLARLDPGLTHTTSMVAFVIVHEHSSPRHRRCLQRAQQRLISSEALQDTANVAISSPEPHTPQRRKVQ